ncbi:MAG: hypothetical protein HZB51_22560 [Chloroflexi bacterium]|nr:hypothetical protein [Chloroflexota bacterium]
MTKQNSKPTIVANAKNNNLGPVAREKYEAILNGRIQQCIAVQEAKIKAQRPKALRIFLEQHQLTDKLTKYRAMLSELITFFGEPDWRSTVWLRDDNALNQQSKVQNGLETILRGLKELKPVYAELDRLHHFQSQVAEKVWLAGAPNEIAELLKEIGEPPANVSKDNAV